MSCFYDNPDEEDGMVRDMGMISLQDVEPLTTLTPSIKPLAASLHSSCLSTHCYACFRPLSSSTTIIEYKLVSYCSPLCHSVDSVLYDQSGEHQLMNFIKENPRLWPVGNPVFPDHSYLRLSLRFLRLIPPGPVLDLYDSHTSPPSYFPFPPRFLGLAWIFENQFSTAHRASELMSKSMKLKHDDNVPYDYLSSRVFTMVISNSLKISNVGIALYDFRISWINHSCKPNSVVCFEDSFQPPQFQSSLLIHPTKSNHVHTYYEDYTFYEPPTSTSTHLNIRDVYSPIMISDLPLGSRNLGPRVVVKSVHAVKKDEEIFISYVDSSEPWEYFKLRHIYRFTCTCTRCEYGEDDDNVVHRISDAHLGHIIVHVPEISSEDLKDDQDKGKEKNSRKIYLYILPPFIIFCLISLKYYSQILMK